MLKTEKKVDLVLKALEMGYVVTYGNVIMASGFANINEIYEYAKHMPDQVLVDLAANITINKLYRGEL